MKPKGTGRTSTAGAGPSRARSGTPSVKDQDSEDFYITSLEIDDEEGGTQFLPKENDEETLWDVEAILQERGNRYFLKWGGTDEHGKPWPNSWVPKYDVTDDLILEWKKKKKEQRKARDREKEIEKSKKKEEKERRKKQKVYGAGRGATGKCFGFLSALNCINYN